MSGVVKTQLKENAKCRERFVSCACKLVTTSSEVATYKAGLARRDSSAPCPWLRSCRNRMSKSGEILLFVCPKKATKLDRTHIVLVND